MAGVVADWRRAALVDRFLRPRIAAAGVQNAPPLPSLAQFLRDAGVSGALQRYHAQDTDADADAGTYAAGLDAFVHDADAYAAPPDELAAAHAPAPALTPGAARPAWYFVSPARSHDGPRCRAPSCKRCGVGASGFFPVGEWVPQRRDSHAEAGSGTVRHVRRYFYVSAENPKVPAGWVMVENGITMEGSCHEELVLCELYRSCRWPAPLP